MQSMYQPNLWHEAFVVLGTGGAALAGLVIVAASVRANQLMTKPYLRMRARNNTLSMITITGGSILVLLPQDATALGIELIVFNLVCACVMPLPVVVVELRNHSGLPLQAPLLAVSCYLLAAAGGVSLIVHWGGGLYLTTAAYFVYLLVAVLNAYLLLLPSQTASPRKSRR